jgi:hemerythrin-like metal-binding protein
VYAENNINHWEIIMKRPTWTISWNDGMSVGIPEIDEDHKRFILLINELNRSITDRKEPAEIKERLQFIIDDAEQHFAHEEMLFKEWRYPDIDRHASQHAQALKELKEIKVNFIPYGLDSAWIDAGLKIKGILINHIIKEDMKYAEFYRNSREVDTSGKV